MHHPQRAKLCVAVLCATVWSVCVTKGASLSLDSNRKAWTPAFNPGCAAFPDKRIIMVTPNSGYWDMFLNWVHHAKAYMGNHDQLVVVAQDQGAITNLQSTEFVFMDLDGNLHQPAKAGEPARELKPSGIQIFNNLVGKRPSEISYFLNQNCTVLYTDIDTVWVGDVFQEIAKAGPHDLYVTDDHWKEGGSIKGMSEGSTDFDNHWYFCSCFLYFQPTPAVQDLVKKWAQGMNAKTPDQPVFNRVLGTDYTTDRLVDFAVLPVESFPNGMYADQYWGKPDIRVLHANYRVGYAAKKQFLEDHGVWKP